MKFKVTRLGAPILGCAAALVFSTAVASADPPDPHKPDMTKGYCPGGRWGWGELAVCDGEKYPDGSFWHQWMKTWMTGPQFYYDCVGGDEPLPGPPPPGGCDGAIPPSSLNQRSTERRFSAVPVSKSLSGYAAIDLAEIIRQEHSVSGWFSVCAAGW